MERSRTDSDGSSVTVRPPVTVEAEPAGSDPRQRVER
jgi:hypothetical protein